MVFASIIIILECIAALAISHASAVRTARGVRSNVFFHGLAPVLLGAVVCLVGAEMIGHDYSGFAILFGVAAWALGLFTADRWLKICKSFENLRHLT